MTWRAHRVKTELLGCLLWQVWPWHVSAVPGNHLPQSDRQRAEIQRPDGQTQHPHLSVCRRTDQAAGGEAGLGCPHPEALCCRVSSIHHLNFPFPSHYLVSLCLMHTPCPTIVLCSLRFTTLNFDFLLFSFPEWLSLPVIILCLMSTVPTCSTSTCRW